MSDPYAILEAQGVLPVAVLDRAADAAPLGAALVAGGLSAIEVTLRTDAAEQALTALARETSLLVGAGTVLNATQAQRAVDAGARFIVSPGLDLGLIEECRRLEVPAIPGVSTASEAQAAVNAGVSVVKLFPAGLVGGLDMIAALAGPFAGLRFLPTGGIGAADVPRYLAHPAVLAVGGSWLVAPKLVAAGDWDQVTRLAAAAVAAVDVARAGVT